MSYHLTTADDVETGCSRPPAQTAKYTVCIQKPARGPIFIWVLSTKYTDEEMGLLYFGYRYYQSEVGRWASRDPIGERGGINLCVFVVNEPIDHADPFGREYKFKIIGAGPGIKSHSGPQDIQVKMEIKSGSCGSKGCFHLSFEDVEMTFVMVAGNKEIHELEHYEDCKKIAYNGLIKYGKSRSGCYKTEAQAKCWKEAVQDYAVSRYVYHFAFQTVIDSDLTQFGLFPWERKAYEKQLEEFWKEYNKAQKALVEKEAECSKLK